MIDFSALKKIGRIAKIFGYNGTVKFESDYDFDDLSEIEFVFINIDEDFVPFKLISSIHRDNRNFNIDLHFVDNESDASKLLMKDVFIDKNTLDNLNNEDYESIKIIGFEVKDIKGEVLGKIINIDKESANELIIIENAGKEILIPFAQEIIKKVDFDLELILVDLPEGLIDLNT